MVSLREEGHENKIRAALEVELMNDPAVSFLHQDIGDRDFFAVEASHIAGKNCRIVVHLSREKFTRVIVGDDRILLHHLLKRLKRKARLCASREIAVGFLVIMLTNSFQLRMDDFGRFKGSSPEPPGEAAWDYDKDKKFSHNDVLGNLFALSRCELNG